MDSDFVQRKYLVVILASVVVGLAAFVGACALVYSTNWFSDEEFGDLIVTAPPLAPPRWSPDGTTIVLHWWRGSYLVDAGSDGARLRRVIVEGNREAIYPRISPDGLQMVFSTQPQEDYEDGSELGVSNLDGSEYRRLMRSRGYQYGPEWSPDGSQIAFISSYRIRQGNHYYQSYSLYTMPTKGSGPRKLSDSVQAGLPTWSPEGQTIAFLGHERVQPGDWEGDAYIYVVDRDGSNLTRLAEASSPPTWSPDGSSIAFLRGDDRYSLFVVKSDGSGLRKLADIDPYSKQKRPWTPLPYLSWSPDGSEILLQDYPFIRVKADGTAYREGGEPYAVFNGPEDWNVAYASWSPDGSRIAVTVEHMGESGPNIGDAILLTMARDGSDKRVLARISTELGLHAVPNEPWDEEAGWVWNPQQEEINPASTGTPTPAGT